MYILLDSLMFLFLLGMILGVQFLGHITLFLTFEKISDTVEGANHVEIWGKTHSLTGAYVQRP